jgi:hypothetical protein
MVNAKQEASMKHVASFNPEDGGNIFSETLADFQETTWHYNPEDRPLQHFSCLITDYPISTAAGVS